MTYQAVSFSLIQRIGVRRTASISEHSKACLRPVDFATPRSPLSRRAPSRAPLFMVRFVVPFPDQTLLLTSFRSAVGKNDLPKWSKGFHRKSYGCRSFRVKHQSSWFLAAASSSGMRITRAPCGKRTGNLVQRAEKFGDLITADHQVSQWKECESRKSHRYAVEGQN